VVLKISGSKTKGFEKKSVHPTGLSSDQGKVTAVRKGSGFLAVAFTHGHNGLWEQPSSIMTGR